MNQPEPPPNPQFPNYSQQPQTAPQGIPIADPKFHKPLYKMMGLLLKPKTNLLKSPFKAPKVRRSQRNQRNSKKVKFY